MGYKLSYNITLLTISLALIGYRESLSFILFPGLAFILYFLDKIYYKEQIIQIDDDEAISIKKAENKLEIELDDINIGRKMIKIIIPMLKKQIIKIMKIM